MDEIWVGNIARKKETRMHAAFYWGNLKAIFHVRDE
jgi:hypothetical protein